MKFTVHAGSTAPEDSQATLNVIEKQFGFIPNLFGVLAESPTAVDAYASINKALTKSNLNPIEQQVVMITVSAENNCNNCVGAHSAIASMVEMPETILSELRQQQSISDARFDALRHFSLLVVNNKGWISENDIQKFLNAGYNKRHVLDVITMVALKTLSNYVNHIAETPLDEQFSAMEWTHKQDKIA